MSITTALKARRDVVRDREAGFTLIELLVVVIIIGILAAIAIPVYIGVQNNAKDSAVKSDLVNAKTSLVAAATDNNGAVPSAVTPGSTTTAGVSTIGGSATFGSTTADLTKYGWSKSTNTSAITYTPGTTTANTGLWCVLATSTTGNKFVVTSNTPVSGGDTSTACPAAY